jgi:hypothetical protein
MVQTFGLMRTFLERPGPGYGIERVLYELNAAVPCMSPMVRAHHAATPGELLQALDDAATRPNRPREPVDRHVVAFLAARFRKVDDRLLALVGGADPGRRVAALLTILWETQRRFGPAELPNLSAWVAELLEPALERFRSRPTRERLKAQFTRAARGGDLDQLMRLIEDKELVRRDGVGFAAARHQYERSMRDVERAEREIEDGDGIAGTVGRRIALASSLLVATLSAAGLLAVTLLR